MVASELAMGLADRGHEVHIISYATPFRLRSFHQNVFIHEVEVSSYPLFKYPPYALSLATKLVDVVREFDLQLLHAHYAVPHATSAYLAQHILEEKGLKTITTLHGTDITLVGMDKSFYEIIKFSIEQSNGVTAVSRYLRDRTLSEFKLTRDIRVIHNFVEIQRYRPESKQCVKSHFAPDGEKILMHASNFRPLKRLGDVVEVFSRVREQVPTKLVLIGEGPERRWVQQRVEEEGLSRDVVFLGEQDYVEHLLPCADLLLLPSEHESFGLVALEAHACGVPVIGTEIGGLHEVVVDGETGFLLPLGDTEGMSEKALQILTQPDLQQLFHVQARRRAVEHFDSEQLIPQYESFYREILG